MKYISLFVICFQLSTVSFAQTDQFWCEDWANQEALDELEVGQELMVGFKSIENKSEFGWGHDEVFEYEIIENDPELSKFVRVASIIVKMKFHSPAVGCSKIFLRLDSNNN